MAYLMNCVTSKLKCALLLVIKCYVKLVENTVQTFYIFINFYLFLVQFLKEECEDYYTCGLCHLSLSVLLHVS